MKKIILIICLFLSIGAAAEELPGQFYITKVNRIKKLYVIQPEMRDFMGSRGVQKFDYERLIPASERGEEYIVTFRYRGEKTSIPLKLRYEYRLALDLEELRTEEYAYTNLKTGNYKWRFKNVGPNYVEKGKVDRWKVSLIFNDKVVAEKRSATWFAMEGT